MTGFSGQKVSVSDYYPVYVPRVPSEGLVAYGVATVGPGVEFSSLADLSTGNLPSGLSLIPISVDVGGNSITEQYPVSSEGTTSVGGNGVGILTELNPYAPRIADVEIIATNIPGLSDANIFFTHNRVFEDTTGPITLPSNQPAYLEVAVQFEHKVDVQANPDGTHLITGLANDQQLYSRGYDTMTGGGVHESFVFKPHFGHDEITDLIVGGPEHDVIKLSSTEFSNFSQVMNHTQDVNGSAVIHVTPNDSITLDGVTKADLVGHPHEFMFHP